MKLLNKLFRKKPTLPPRLPHYEDVNGTTYIERFYDNLPNDWWYFVVNTYSDNRLIKSEAYGFSNELLLEQSIDFGLKLYSSKSNGLVYHYPNSLLDSSKKDLLLITDDAEGLTIRLEVIGKANYLVKGEIKTGQVMTQTDCLNIVVSYLKNPLWGEAIFGFKTKYQFPLNAKPPRSFISRSPNQNEFTYIEINSKRYRAKVGTYEFMGMEYWNDDE